MPFTSLSTTRIGRAALPVRGIAAWMVAPLLAMSCTVTAQESTLALWKTQEISFSYTSRNSIYSCGALRNRVESLLLAVGANADLKVSVSNCDDFIFPGEPSAIGRQRRFDEFGGVVARARGLGSGQFSSVSIRLRTPIEATPEAIAELEKTKGYRELLGRVTNNNAAVQEAAAQFPAQRQLIPLTYQTLRLEPEECELIEQMSRSVFPRLNVRVVERGFTCNPRQRSFVKPRLKVEALIPTPPPAATQTSTPPPIPASPAEPAGAAAPAKSDDAAATEPGTDAASPP